MYLMHYLEDKECEKKTYYRELNLVPFEGKEKHYKEIFEVVVASLAKEKDSFLRDLKYLIKEKYSDSGYGHANEAAEIRELVLKLFSRLYEYLKSKNCKVVSPGFEYSVDEVLDIEFKCDLVVENADGSYEGIIFQSPKPSYSYKGRKFETKVTNSIELNGLLKAMTVRFKSHIDSGGEIMSSIYHLRNKEDKGALFPNYEHKKGANIVSLSMGEVIKSFKLEKEDLNDHFERIMRDYLDLSREKNCKDCRHSNICNFETNKSKLKKDSIRLKESSFTIEQAKVNEVVKLNDEQQLIIDNLNGKCQVVAGPGSGKTRIIVECIKKLVNEKVNPKSILALTFTNKATDELLERLGGIEGVKVTNYNTFGYNIVREFYQELNYEYPPRLVTMFESFEIIKSILEMFGVNFRYENLYNRTYGQMWDIFNAVNYAISKGMMRNTLMLELEKPEYREKFNVSEKIMDYIPLIASRYYYILREKNLISYDQQIDLVNELFKKNENVVAKLRNQYKYVFLDEYQDTNEQQHKMIMKFATGNVCMVGDEDQSIYGFRGSEPMNFLSFMKDGQNKFFLCRNYRCGTNIINAANELIRMNVMRNNKTLIPGKKNLGVYAEHVISSSIDIVKIVDELVEKNIRLEDIAIITRKNKHIEVLKEHLTDVGYFVKTNFNRLLDDEAFILFRALLRVIALKSIREDEYIVMKHLYGLDRISKFGSIISAAMVNSSDVYDKFIIDLASFSSLITDSEKIEYMFEMIGAYGSETHKYIKDIYEGLHIVSLYELLDVIEGMVQIDEDVTIPTMGEGINLMTAHSSKGLEFKAVIVYATNEFKSNGNEEEEEERRLLYVAMTRAEDELHMVAFSEKGEINKKEVA